MDSTNTSSGDSINNNVSNNVDIDTNTFTDDSTTNTDNTNNTTNTNTANRKLSKKRKAQPPPPPPPSSSSSSPSAAAAAAVLLSSLSSSSSSTVSSSTVSSSTSSSSSSSSSSSLLSCNCRKSKCLKLYCSCFEHNRYCDGCCCIDCSNTIEHNDKRTSAMNAITLRNPNAFSKKNDNDGNDDILMVKGCNCIKSHCLKRYCSCFANHVNCGILCHCQGCSNTIDTNAIGTHDNTTVTNFADTLLADTHTHALITNATGTLFADNHTTEVMNSISNSLLGHDITNISDNTAFPYLA